MTTIEKKDSNYKKEPKNARIPLDKITLPKIIELQKKTGIQNLTDLFRFCLTYTFENFSKQRMEVNSSCPK